MAASPASTVLLALLGAMFFGSSGMAARYGLLRGNARLGSLISIGTTAALYCLLLPLMLREGPWRPGTLWPFLLVFGAIGLFTPSLSLFLSFEGNRRLGPTVSGTIASTAPLFGAGSAVLLLGEHMSLGALAGTLAIVAGVMVLSRRGRAVQGAPRAAAWWAALFPLGAALVRGCGHMAARYGFDFGHAPLSAALVTYGVSFLAVCVTDQVGGAPRAGRNLHARLGGGLPWFVATGVLNALALACQYTALAGGRVVVVSPIVSTYPLFTFAISLALRVERLSVRILAGVALVVLGVVAVGTQ